MRSRWYPVRSGAFPLVVKFPCALRVVLLLFGVILCVGSALSISAFVIAFTRSIPGRPWGGRFSSLGVLRYLSRASMVDVGIDSVVFGPFRCD